MPTDKRNSRDSSSVSRRHFLQTGGFASLGLTLSRLLQARAAERLRGPGSRLKACILLFYYGGPSHLETYDPKPNAPAEIRGEFRPIATSVPGLHVSEYLPHMARVMHKVALVRSMTHGMRNHDSACTVTLSGRPLFRGDTENFSPVGEALAPPGHGALLSYLRRNLSADLPHAALPFFMRNLFPPPGQGAGFLGAAYNPLLVQGDPATRSYQADLLRLPEGLTRERLGQRADILRAFVEGEGRPNALRPYYDRAFRLLGSEAVRQALDVEREPLRVRERYGITWPGLTFPEDNITPELRPSLPLRGQNLLLARRLVEAGVPFVNVYDFRVQGANWDTHTGNFERLKGYLIPPADQALSALIEDLDQRGLLDTTLVVAVGEFGRTPKINKKAGRDHWPDCYSAVLAGGGVIGGAVHGSSDRSGGYPAADPVTPGDLAATIFWRFGLDPATEVRDATGRPFPLAEGKPVTGLFKS